MRASHEAAAPAPRRSPPVTAAYAPSSCSGPRPRTNVCSGWRPKRRTCGSSAASGVAPLTCATHGPGSIVAATSAIAPSGTQRRTSSARPASRARRARAAVRRSPRRRVRGADDLYRFEHQKLQFRSGYRATEVYRRASRSMPTLPRRCRSTSTCAWSASRTSRSSSGTGSDPACPDCGAAKVRKQFSVFAAHGTAEQPSFGGRAVGGGCCGGSCGCGH